MTNEKEDQGPPSSKKPQSTSSQRRMFSPCCIICYMTDDLVSKIVSIYFRARARSTHWTNISDRNQNKQLFVIVFPWRLRVTKNCCIICHMTDDLVSKIVSIYFRARAHTTSVRVLHTEQTFQIEMKTNSCLLLFFHGGLRLPKIAVLQAS